jgi:hypothetical protein
MQMAPAGLAEVVDALVEIDVPLLGASDPLLPIVDGVDRASPDAGGAFRAEVVDA